MTIQCLCVYCVNLTLLFLLPILLLLLLILLLLLDITSAHPYCSHNKASSRTPNSKHLKETDLFFILSLLFYYLLLIKYINCLPRDYSLSLSIMICPRVENDLIFLSAYKSFDLSRVSLVLFKLDCCCFEDDNVDELSCFCL